MLEDTALRVGDTHLELMIIPLIEILRLNEVPKSSSQPALALIYLASLHDLFQVLHNVVPDISQSYE